MEYRVENPNESFRRAVFITAVFLFSLIGIQFVFDPTLWPVVIAEVIAVTWLIIVLLFMRPFVVLYQSSVAVKYFFRERRYSCNKNCPPE